MKHQDVEAFLKSRPVPRAPESLRARVLEEARRNIESSPPRTFRASRAPRASGGFALAAALAAVAVGVAIILLGPDPAPPPDPTTVEDLAERVRDPNAPARARAAKRLGEIGGRKAMPTLASVLRDRDPEVRAAAAAALCLNGCADLGVPVLLREGREFDVLNALRRPEEWSRAGGRDGLDRLARRPAEIILESDGVRYVTREEALRFWRAWWNEGAYK